MLVAVESGQDGAADDAQSEHGEGDQDQDENRPTRVAHMATLGYYDRDAIGGGIVLGEGGGE